MKTEPWRLLTIMLFLLIAHYPLFLYNACFEWNRLDQYIVTDLFSWFVGNLQVMKISLPHEAAGYRPFIKEMIRLP
ncbi:hypothetical protein Desac_2911 [Desulfobacca acetoxidans DSM 11109]|uniref:Uncharacterized protein n=1 Tax=Desulfobacca acetoxidans (strain ATCC 700848 / DSM 11109 / ASRB2) TaxID=880072 RepID=F2NE81_DESAR|nr:hypothetical protein Desac_2911 [Desulfobacca acetoxidans DSM 11109]